MANRLARETSPYLLQHANNPVDWYPWGPDALERARAENKPILLSIGYAACHWCHVMEHESFEDEATAALMNDRFVNVKVDREERPDLDAIYMQAVQAMTGHGGWPMTVFLTPETVPFFCGTYFPKVDRHGLPSFTRVLTALSDAYRTKPEDIARTASSVREMYATATEATHSEGPLTTTLLEHAYRALAAHYDSEHGGFGGAPKFPQAMALDFLVRHWSRGGEPRALDMAAHGFRSMARGGIYDQLGGGFARYAVDAHWLVPHFEKMLYDNALLARLGVHLWQATKDDEIRRVTEETIDWVAREMTSPDGGFYSSLDADSEGHEGTFYVWSEGEIDSVLGDDAPLAKAYWGVSAGGNFEGRNILSVAEDPAAIAGRTGIAMPALRAVIERSRRALFAAREARVRPGLDDKVLASWNALMLVAIAGAARAFDRDDYRALAVRSARALFESLAGDGRVRRSYKAGVATTSGFLEDHAAFALAALAMYELTFDASWADRARAYGASMVEWFWDDETGAFYDTPRDHERLITRPRDTTDNAVPSGTSLAAEVLARLAELYDDADARRRATYILETLAPAMARHPLAFGRALEVADTLARGATDVVIVGEPTSSGFQALDRVASKHYMPALVMAGGAERENGDIALAAGRTARDGIATAYLCRNHVCDEPVTSAERFAEQINALRG
jgi:uncharacterized protein